MTSFNAIRITEHVYWVGAIDAELRDFHGYSTSYGTTYNAYLIIGDEPILIDTVKAPFYEEMLTRIASVLDPKKIKYIISNHAEMDHSGSLPKAIQLIKPQRVFASCAGVDALNAHFHDNFALTTVSDAEELSLGNARFKFFETRMLHWPDSMFTFYANDGVLFSQDAFGMHLATTKLFATEHEQSLLRHEAAKYYANILLPYSSLVLKLLDKLPALNLNLKIIAPDHGPIWNREKEINWIVSCWRSWAEQRKTDKIVIVYATMWYSTMLMATAIADGMAQSQVEVKIMPMMGSHRSDVATELLEAKGLVVGSPTINQQVFPTIADVMCYLKGLKPQNLCGQVFGSYGWSGEALALLQKDLQSMRVKLISEAVKAKYVPTTNDLVNCHNLGVALAESIK